MNWDKIISSDRIRRSTRTSTIDKRNEFESDYGRVIFSPSIRRMHDKTQVFPLTSDDNIHTRLTHSLEVQSVAHSIGMNICLIEKFYNKFSIKKEDLIRIIPSILSSIALCHDIGNPPFGHFGEKVISKFFKEYFKENNRIELNDSQKMDFTEFDGNAQGFRVLTKLQPLQDAYGLNLTIGTLSAFLKYPNLSNEISKTQEGYKNKLGVFQSEKNILKFIRKGSGLGKNIRNPLAFLMESADTICYLAMDIEDGFNKGYYSFEEIIEYLEKNINNKQIIKNLKNRISENVKETINKKRTKIVILRIFLIQELVNIAINRFIEKINDIDNGKFNQELIINSPNCLAKVLLNFTKEKIFAQREIQTLELTGECILKGLLKHFVYNFISYNKKSSTCAKSAEKLYSIISKSVKSAVYFEIKKDKLYSINDYYKLRMIVDYITGMTDNFALNLYQKLEGIRII